MALLYRYEQQVRRATVCIGRILRFFIVPTISRVHGLVNVDRVFSSAYPEKLAGNAQPAMTDVQFYFALGVPMFSIMVVWLGSILVNTRAVNALNHRIDDLRSEVKAGFDSLNERLDRLDTRFDRIEDEVRKDHEYRLGRLEAKVFTSAA